MKHLFTDVLNGLLEERANSYQTLATVRWERALSKRTAQYFTGKFIEDIDEPALLRYFSFIRFKENGELYSDKYLKGILGLTKAVFRRATLRGYLDRNPFDGDLRLPRGNIPEPTERILDNDELKRLLDICKNSMLFSTIIPLLAATGMRIGELLGLYWSDIDFDRRCLHIRRAVGVKYVQLPDGRIVHDGAQICRTKTQTSLRDLPMTSSTVKLLREWYDYRESEACSEWRKRIEHEHNLNLVFPNREGRLMCYHTLRENFNGLTEEENLNATFHKLRHSYASNLIECGVDIAVISKLLGHKSITTTADTYTKIRYEPKAAAIEKLEKYMEDNDLI